MANCYVTYYVTNRAARQCRAEAGCSPFQLQHFFIKMVRPASSQSPDKP